MFGERGRIRPVLLFQLLEFLGGFLGIVCTMDVVDLLLELSAINGPPI
jgi:hypothetical protein